MNSRRWNLFPVLVAILLIPVLVAANDDEETKRAYLGIRMQRIDGELGEALSVEEGSGVLVGQVMDESPASKAGIQEGDVIVKVDGSDVGSPEMLGELIRSKSDGEKVNVQLMRDGKSKSVTVTLAEAPEEMGNPFGEHQPHPGWFESAEDDDSEPAKMGYLGVMTQPLSTELGEYFGVKEGKGALVSEVVESSPAAKLGLRAGDVITWIDDREIDGPGDLLRTMRDIGEVKTVKVSWVRAKKARSGSVELEVRDAARPGRDARRMMRRFDRFTTPPPPMGGDMSGMKAEIESLRGEIEKLRIEMQRMKQDVYR
jgi:S1-C subfamily serine protease